MASGEAAITVKSILPALMSAATRSSMPTISAGGFRLVSLGTLRKKRQRAWSYSAIWQHNGATNNWSDFLASTLGRRRWTHLWQPADSFTRLTHPTRRTACCCQSCRHDSFGVWSTCSYNTFHCDTHGAG
jgi:hypothetical protein